MQQTGKNICDVIKSDNRSNHSTKLLDLLTPDDHFEGPRSAPSTVLIQNNAYDRDGQ